MRKHEKKLKENLDSLKSKIESEEINDLLDEMLLDSKTQEILEKNSELRIEFASIYDESLNMFVKKWVNETRREFINIPTNQFYLGLNTESIQNQEAIALYQAFKDRSYQVSKNSQSSFLKGETVKHRFLAMERCMRLMEKFLEVRDYYDAIAIMQAFTAEKGQDFSLEGLSFSAKKIFEQVEGLYDEFKFNPIIATEIETEINQSESHKVLMVGKWIVEIERQLETNNYYNSFFIYDVLIKNGLSKIREKLVSKYKKILDDVEHYRITLNKEQRAFKAPLMKKIGSPFWKILDEMQRDVEAFPLIPDLEPYKHFARSAVVGEMDRFPKKPEELAMLKSDKEYWENLPEALKKVFEKVVRKDLSPDKKLIHVRKQNEILNRYVNFLTQAQAANVKVIDHSIEPFPMANPFISLTKILATIKTNKSDLIKINEIRDAFRLREDNVDDLIVLIGKYRIKEESKHGKKATGVMMANKLLDSMLAELKLHPQKSIDARSFSNTVPSRRVTLSEEPTYIMPIPKRDRGFSLDIDRIPPSMHEEVRSTEATTTHATKENVKQDAGSIIVHAGGKSHTIPKIDISNISPINSPAASPRESPPLARTISQPVNVGSSSVPQSSSVFLKRAFANQKVKSTSALGNMTYSTNIGPRIAETIKGFQELSHSSRPPSVTSTSSQEDAKLAGHVLEVAQIFGTIASPRRTPRLIPTVNIETVEENVSETAESLPEIFFLESEFLNLDELPERKNNSSPLLGGDDVTISYGRVSPLTTNSPEEIEASFGKEELLTQDFSDAEKNVDEKDNVKEESRMEEEMLDVGKEKSESTGQVISSLSFPLTRTVERTSTPRAPGSIQMSKFTNPRGSRVVGDTPEMNYHSQRSKFASTIKFFKKHLGLHDRNASKKPVVASRSTSPRKSG